jgi:hypothetical protein
MPRPSRSRESPPAFERIARQEILVLAQRRLVDRLERVAGRVGLQEQDEN